MRHKNKIYRLPLQINCQNIKAVFGQYLLTGEIPMHLLNGSDPLVSQDTLIDKDTKLGSST